MHERSLVYGDERRPLSKCSTEHLLYARDSFSEGNNIDGVCTLGDLHLAIDIELQIRQRGLR